GHRRLVRSTNGGATFNAVFASSQAAGSSTGQTEDAISNTGRIFLGIDGGTRILLSAECGFPTPAMWGALPV
ncbi:MAG TPA: hypothetical protein VM884_04105, partial [Flavisolibacter sp.]|nr:hypothetical protein [Flavisolibacter sp.]